jgi:hypothetical protein
MSLPADHGGDREVHSVSSEYHVGKPLNPLDPFLHRSGPEVQKEACRTVSDAQIGEQLATVNRRERLE